LGARVTGEANPVENRDASSAVIRRAVEDRSSLSGNAGRWRDEMEMAEGRRPGPTVEFGAGGEFVGVGCVMLIWETSASEVVGRVIRVDVGDREADFERVWVAIDALSTS
jgi:hypothetical protein